MRQDQFIIMINKKKKGIYGRLPLIEDVKRTSMKKVLIHQMIPWVEDK